MDTSPASLDYLNRRNVRDHVIGSALAQWKAAFAVDSGVLARPPTWYGSL